jgi:hypothetical protein
MAINIHTHQRRSLVLYQATFNDPHMEVDGVVKKVSYQYWAQQTLSAEEFEKFKQAKNRQDLMWNEMRSQGLIELSSNSDGTANNVTLKSIVLHDPEYVKFMRQMLRDPAVTWPGPGIKPIY